MSAWSEGKVSVGKSVPSVNLRLPVLSRTVLPAATTNRSAGNRMKSFGFTSPFVATSLYWAVRPRAAPTQHQPSDAQRDRQHLRRPL